MAASVVKCWGKTLKRWVRAVRTATGVSTKSYKTEEGDCPHAGEVQGSANVMGNWTNTSDAILSIQAEKNEGIKMTHAATQEFSKRTVDAYVDDADLYATGKESKIILNEEDGTPEDTSNDNAVFTTKNVGKAAQNFSNLVSVAGQHKASHKCGYQISAWWKNKKGRLVQRDTSEINEKIQIEDHKGIKTEIKKWISKKPTEDSVFS